MKDFFTRRYDEKYKYSIYYLENQKQMICKASRTIRSFIHKLTFEVNGVEKYRLVRTKGSSIMEILMSLINNFKSIEFSILMNKNENIGMVKFKNKKSIELIFNEIKYILTSHGRGYFSIKRNNKQIALLKREPVAKCLYNRYCVWYEPEINASIDVLLLLLSINDYMFYCNNWEYYTQKEISSEITWKFSDYASGWTSFKNVTDPEVQWKPSDSTNETNAEDCIYLTKIEQIQKKVNKHTVFVIILLVLFIFMFFIIAI